MNFYSSMIEYVIEQPETYDTPELFEAYTNYHKCKQEHYAALGIGKSVSDMFSEMAILKQLDKAVKAAVIKSGGKWED